MNSKSVYGLQNDFDGDAEPHQSSPDLQSSEADLNSREIFYESGTIDNEQNSKWKKYTPADLKIPITSALTNFNKPSTSKIQNDEDIHITTTPDSHRWKLPSSRRRPTLHVKALTRSELAEKCDKLIDKRLEIAKMQKQKLEEELATIREERNLNFNLLELQIEMEKEKLKQLKK